MRTHTHTHNSWSLDKTNIKMMWSIRSILLGFSFWSNLLWAKRLWLINKVQGCFLNRNFTLRDVRIHGLNCTSPSQVYTNKSQRAQLTYTASVRAAESLFCRINKRKIKDGSPIKLERCPLFFICSLSSMCLWLPAGSDEYEDHISEPLCALWKVPFLLKRSLKEYFTCA